MTIFCPSGHMQTNLSAMGDLCEACMMNDPEEFNCKRENCPTVSVMGPDHTHPEDGPGFVDLFGNPA